jgi:hypothetical protein
MKIKLFLINVSVAMIFVLACSVLIHPASADASQSRIISSDVTLGSENLRHISNDVTILAPTAVITISANITSDTTWTASNVYILTTDIRIVEGVVLTINPGTVIKPWENTRLIVDGVLNARGTLVNPIVFTSYKDDTYGGDTNGDGSVSAPAPNDWGWIRFSDTSVDNQNILEYCTILYGGKDNWNYNTNYYYGAVRLIMVLCASSAPPPPFPSALSPITATMPLGLTLALSPPSSATPSPPMAPTALVFMEARSPPLALGQVPTIRMFWTATSRLLRVLRLPSRPA